MEIKKDHWWNERDRYHDHYYREEAFPAPSSAIELAVRTFFASLPFIHYVSPKLDAGIWIAIEGVVTYDHLTKARQGPRTFLVALEDLFTIGSMLGNKAAEVAATVIDTGLSLEKLIYAETWRSTLYASVRVVANVTSLIQNHESIRLIHNLAKVTLLLLSAEKEFRVKRHWIEPASNIAQAAIKLFGIYDFYKPTTGAPARA